MPDASGFAVTIYENEYLPEAGTEVNAVATVTASGAAAAAAPSEKAVVLIVDTSGSMEAPPSKIRAARKAAATACQLLPDGTLFGLISGAGRRPRSRATYGEEAARRSPRGSIWRASCSSPTPTPSASPTSSPMARIASRSRVSSGPSSAPPESSSATLEAWAPTGT
jgi:hypothetical protein